MSRPSRTRPTHATPDASERLTRYLAHPTLAVVQRLTLYGYDVSLGHAIAHGAPRTLREVVVHVGATRRWPALVPSDADRLLSSWRARLPALERVQLFGVAPAEAAEETDSPRGPWARFWWFLGF